jgi:sulfur-oxidizing protein SoxX
MKLKIIIFCIIIFYSFFNTIYASNDTQNYEIIDYAIPKPLTSNIGDPVKGLEIVISREGNCLACHNIPNIDDLFQGNIGPSLAGVGNRYTIAELRLRLVNPYVLNSDSLMPAFYKVNGLIRVDKKYIGESILSAQQIEDVISWLITLKK